MRKLFLRFNILLIVLSFFVACSSDKTAQITSPDGKITVTFNLLDDKPFYAVQKNGKDIVSASKLGFKLSAEDSLCSGFQVVDVAIDSLNETWQQPWGEEIEVRNHYNELKISLQEKAGKQRLLNIVFRAFDEGIGFCYEFPEQKNLKEFEIADELTEFAMVADDSVWTIPAYKGEYYELIWKKRPVSTQDTVTTPVTIETAGGGYILLHEAKLVDYAKMNLYPVSGTTLKADLTPWSTGVKVYAKPPFVTPWRTIILADNLNQLVNARVMLNLNEPSKIEDTSWIRPSKYIGIWWGMHMKKYTWAQGPKHGATTKNMKEYIDFAAANQIPGVLVEGWNYGWDGDWVANGDKFSFTKPYPDFDIGAIVKYAAEKGVEIIGHNETGGSTINYENQLDSAFSFLQAHGIHSVKTGYVNALLDKKERHSSQYGVRHYLKVIETAAKYQMMIDNHEPVMPTGLHRTYPNLMTQEGVRGQEYDAWSQDGGNPPEHTCVVPFTRGLAGPVDFTFGTFNFTNPVHPQTRVQTTIAKQLALYVVIYSPLQMASDLPKNYMNNPAFEFINLVPVDWQKTIVPDGKIGDYVVTARKDKYSGNWFVGAITDENQRNLTLKLDFLTAGKKYRAKIFKDASDAHWKTNPYPVVIEESEVDATSVIDLYLAPGGGTAIILKEL
ncbi:MAG TPA: alpha-glucosidase [Prolixibacteraceae bacterium]|nr:alpha-glucosidase [Prolixibacteraceae bacterium]